MKNHAFDPLIVATSEIGLTDPIFIWFCQYCNGIVLAQRQISDMPQFTYCRDCGASVTFHAGRISVAFLPKVVNDEGENKALEGRDTEAVNV